MVFEVGDARATTLAIGPRESTRKARVAGSRESARTSSAKPVSPRGCARAFLVRAATQKAQWIPNTPVGAMRRLRSVIDAAAALCAKENVRTFFFKFNHFEIQTY